MRLDKSEFRPGAFAWILGLLFLHCVLDSRQAGTSTTVTNPIYAETVTGVAILYNGKPAAGAEISLRLPVIQVSHAGIPTSKLVASTIADDSGKFTVPMVFMKDVYMEIREAAVGNQALARDSQQVHLRRWPNGLPLDGKMGTFRMEAPGGITGIVASTDSAAVGTRWIGVRGTDNFTTAIGKAAFRLGGVSTGLRELVIVSIADSVAGSPDTTRKFTVADTVATAEVKSGLDTNLQSIYYINE